MSTNDRLWLADSFAAAPNNLFKKKPHEQKIQRAWQASELWNRMLLSMLECVQSIDRLSALLFRGKKKKRKEKRKKNDLCWNVAYGSDNFTPDGALETSIVQGKTQMAVQSLAMTELQTGERDKARWKWQQKGPHSLWVSAREERRATYAQRRQAEKKKTLKKNLC